MPKKPRTLVLYVYYTVRALFVQNGVPFFVAQRKSKGEVFKVNDTSFKWAGQCPAHLKQNYVWYLELCCAEEVFQLPSYVRVFCGHHDHHDHHEQSIKFIFLCKNGGKSCNINLNAATSFARGRIEYVMKNGAFVLNTLFYYVWFTVF